MILITMLSFPSNSVLRSIESSNVFATINSSVVLPCDSKDGIHILERNWFVNMEPLEEVMGYRTLLQNGSLHVRVHMEDANMLYACRATGVSPNLTEEIETFYYKIDPIVGAFVYPSVTNLTIDWGTNYTFPCGFGGTLPLEELLILNKRVVNEKSHNITEDSVVECKATNKAGMMHDIAYIKIRPGSKAWALKYGLLNNSYCQPYSTALSNSSICLPYLSELSSAQQDGSYLIARSRLYSFTRTETAVTNLFAAWDRLLLKEQQLVQVNRTVLDASGKLPMSFTAWRCVDWAKRLTCALVYPQCHNLIMDEIQMYFHPNEFFKELSVCQSDCLVVSGLFCLATLNAGINTSSVEPLLYHSSTHYDSFQTGWDQLIRIPEAEHPALPSLFVTFHSSRPELNTIKTCSPRSDDPNSVLIDPENMCTRLPVEELFPVPISSEQTTFDVQIPAPDRSTDQCITGNGMHYHGSATVTGCLPWAMVRIQMMEQDTDFPLFRTAVSTFDSHTFPLSLNIEASTASVCRNPAGIAPLPFCLSWTTFADTFNVLTNYSVVNHDKPTSDGWRMTLCSHIPLCADVVEGISDDVAPGLSDPNLNVALGAVNVQVIIACALVACFILLVIISYVIWRANRCGFSAPSNSSLCLSALEFADLFDDKGNLTGKRNLDDDLGPDEMRPNRLCRRISVDSSSKRACLQYRLRWNRRRRRLRQINPAFRTLVHCWYVFSDFITCKSKPPECSSSILMMTSPLETEVKADGTYVAAQNTSCATLKPVEPNRQLWPLLDRIRPRGWFSHSSGSTAHTARTLRSTVPLRSEEYDEFEANTLCMQLDKPVAYVANAMVSSSRNQLAAGSYKAEQGKCENCGVIQQLPGSLCLVCRNMLAEAQGAVHKKPFSQPSQLHIDSKLMPFPCDEQDPGFSLTQSSMQLLNSGPSDLGWTIKPEKLFNMASMTHLLHPKLKQVCYPQSRLIEVRRLAKRAFGWVLLARAPDLRNLVRRHRLLSLTAAERLGLLAGGGNPTEDSELVYTEDYSSDPLVVVKMLSNDVSLEAEANFLREAEVLIELSHKNIIRLLGICLPLKPLSLLLEYMPFGDLTTFLKHYEQSDGNSRIFPQHMTATVLSAINGDVVSRPHTRVDNTRLAADVLDRNKQTWLPPIKLTCTDLLGMARDACEAMVYLSDSYYVHRDVATRSFLVGNKMVIKLADFSMCRPIQPGVDFVAPQDVFVPVKWLPLESILGGLFQVDTDVWSFGIFMWELFTYASEPYGDLSHEKVISFLDRGQRMSRPPGCPTAVFDLMLSCWSADRKARPTFYQLRSHLSDILSQTNAPS
ncbi:hypothetical protein EG68_06481 [Paragonimus skrjabini miyazakii]|uniref:Uncharacterized protein n=1 Tax=Paragonimus skrjabini miyazakii TaxID=59628 RepID=A0A8S9YNV0_9TREM|nr:hypothetical protein EG68_06481 [Paragonimus skrjabini miyazakii]